MASVGKVMFFGCTVVSTVTRARSLFFKAPAIVSEAQGLLQQNVQVIADTFAPMAQTRTLVLELVLE